jgi:phosphoribosylglycinamide formyltransferase 1
LKIGIFISGTGTNMEALIKAHQKGLLTGVSEISFVFSNKKNAPGIKKAEDAGIKTIVIPKSKEESVEDYERKVFNEVRKYNTGIIVLGGFMRVLSSVFLNLYRGRIINIHPSLLPAFKGVDAQKQAYDYGVKISGCSVHFVDETLDGGPIILQSAVERKDSDTLESFKERILEQEHRLLVSAVSIAASGDYEIRDRFVLIKRRK